jgi:hypothetical protein
VIDHPRADELVEAVARWIEGVRPNLAGRDAFLARVVVNALGVVQRELAQGPAAHWNAVDRFSALLGHSGDLASLNSEVCALIRTQQWDVNTPGLLAALKANITEQIAIDQPNYSSIGGR